MTPWGALGRPGGAFGVPRVVLGGAFGLPGLLERVPGGSLGALWRPGGGPWGAPGGARGSLFVSGSLWCLRKIVIPGGVLA